MPNEKQREYNISLVVEKALEAFLELGIEKTKVADIAKRAGLTERSVFRYFDTKADLVLAASILYWERTLQRIEDMFQEQGSTDGSSGLDDVARLLSCYTRLYKLDPKGLRFTLDAEMCLHSAGKLHQLEQPPEPYETSVGPVAKAIRKGLKDGSISPAVDVREIYYNSYDCILGMMQRLSIGGTPSAMELDYDSRMLHLTEMFVKALSGK